MKKNLPIITGLRFIAAFYVFIFHLDMRKSLDFFPPVISKIISQGAVGVNMFFILSGFILFYTYWNRKVNYGEFILKRLAKIYPAYLAGFALCLIVYFGVKMKVEDFTTVLTLNFLMLESWIPDLSMKWYGGGAWSISTEFFFYLIFPVILQYILTISKTKIILLAIAMYLCSMIPGILFHFKMINFNLNYTFPPSRMFEFIIGMLTATLVFKYKLKTSNVVIALVLITSSLFFFYIGTSLKGYTIQNIIVIPLTLIFLIVATTMKKKSLLSVLGTPFFEYLGKISYCFYIVQIPIFLVLDKNFIFGNISAIWYCLIVFIINFTLAIMIYHLVENPAHKFLSIKIKQFYSRKHIKNQND